MNLLAAHTSRTESLALYHDESIGLEIVQKGSAIEAGERGGASVVTLIANWMVNVMPVD